MQDIKHLDTSNVSYILGLIRDIVNQPSVLDDTNLQTTSTFSSVKIDNLLTALKTDLQNDYKSLIANLNRLKKSVVTTLPTTDIDLDTLYMLKKTDASNNDYFDQYLYLNSTWELVATTSVADGKGIEIYDENKQYVVDDIVIYKGITDTYYSIYICKNATTGTFVDTDWEIIDEQQEFVIVDTSAPSNTKAFWVDITDTTKPVLKFHNGTNWITVSGTNGKSAYEIAVDNGFVGTETEWLESLKGSDGDKGDNGITPHIDKTTKNWFIGDVDTGILAEGTNGKDGKSISSITKDDDNNIIVTFTDGTTQNIGKLSVDIQGDFLTSDGFGNIRYYNGKFQYYNKTSSTWIDIETTTDNKVVVNMIPQHMKNISLSYNRKTGYIEIKFTEPDDTYIDGQLLCAIEKVVLVRKKDSEPQSIDDGDKVVEIKRRDFGSYSDTPYVDDSFTPNIGDIYYYKAFPVSTFGYVNDFSSNTKSIEIKDAVIYGFKLDQNESDPASMITYLSDCDNAHFNSAYMDYSTGTFNYGDWEDAWFIKNLKPCMLKYDGTVDYELDKNDYTKKTDGTDSDVANASYGGNAMVGIPKVYWKIVDNGDDTANIYISDGKPDENYVCWSHIDNNGNEIDYCYMPIYAGSVVNNKLRSLSGKTPINSQSGTSEITYAKANNLTSDTIWYTEVFSDRMLINLLLLLIGKSTDTQTVFGNGHTGSYITSTGTMNNNGLFYGTNGTREGVKVFGMEHWWGNQWRRTAGWINYSGTQKIKMTYGQSDGSTVDGYNTDGTGYIVIGNSAPIGTSGGCISKVLFNENGLIPTTTSGSQTTYYCDGLKFNNSQINYAFLGGAIDEGYNTGALCANLSFVVESSGHITIAAALSCKPLATT